MSHIGKRVNLFNHAKITTLWLRHLQFTTTFCDLFLNEILLWFTVWTLEPWTAKAFLDFFYLCSINRLKKKFSLAKNFASFFRFNVVNKVGFIVF